MRHNAIPIFVIIALVSCSAAACTSTSRPAAALRTPAFERLLAGGLPTPPQALVTPLPTRRMTAQQICADARLGTIASASATTVGAIRSIVGGHGSRPRRLLPDALRPAPNSAQAAWCWIGTGPSSWRAYLASPGLSPERVGDLRGQSDPPVGEYPLR